jgi:integrase
VRRKLTPAFCSKALCEPRKDRTLYWDAELKGFGLQVTAAGKRTCVIQYRAGRKSRRMAIGGLDVLGLQAARKEAKKRLGEVAKGGDPLATRREEKASASNTLKSVADEYFRRERARVRSMDNRAATFARLIFPELGSQPIDKIRRDDITRLLDSIEDANGPMMARKVLSYLRRLFRWHTGRTTDFLSPIVPGMSRPNSKPRERILSDDELRAVWRAAEAHGGPFGYLVRFIILTATRRMEAAAMTWRELDGDRWTIPAVRYKTGTNHVIPLPKAGKVVLKQIPNLGAFVFTNDGRTPIGGISRLKADFDEACGVTGWVLHDLRRTARSLMSRAGIPSDHAERALGHVIGGVRATYDKYQYLDEKRRAFEALAAQIERIVNPRENVMPLRGAS